MKFTCTQLALHNRTIIVQKLLFIAPYYVLDKNKINCYLTRLWGREI